MDDFTVDNWLVVNNWLMVHWFVNDRLVVHWLVNNWLVVHWFMVDNWVLNNLVLVLEDWSVISLVVSVAVSVESLHESLGFVVLSLEEGVTELSDGRSKSFQLVSQCISKSATNRILGLSEGISLSVKEGIKPLL